MASHHDLGIKVPDPLLEVRSLKSWMLRARALDFGCFAGFGMETPSLAFRMSRALDNA